MEITERFASALKHFRDMAGLSQEELAAKAKIDRTFVSQLERGLKSPTLNTLQKLASCLGVDPRQLLREPRGANAPTLGADYVVRSLKEIVVMRSERPIRVSTNVLTSSIDLAHGLIDDLYSSDLDIASVLGLRNLSAFIGELVASAILKSSQGLFERNPHQDGYPDLLLMDSQGKREWDRLRGRLNEKSPFSPFPGGGIEVKATCGKVPTPESCRKRGIARPEIGDTRIGCLTGYDWKAHHRETNNLVGVLWDFVDGCPRIAAMFYSSDLDEEDWRPIVKPRAGGGRTTSVSIMSRAGLKKMYDGWICALERGDYAQFLNRSNKSDYIPVP